MFVRLNTPLPGKKHWWMHCELNSWPVEVHGTLLFFLGVLSAGEMGGSGFVCEGIRFRNGNDHVSAALRGNACS